MKTKNSDLRLKYLPEELRALVKWSVGILGEVIRHELGPDRFETIEGIRRQMAALRGGRDSEDSELGYRVLQKQLERFRSMDEAQRLEVSRAFGLMLEVMNACENAYRSWRLRTQTRFSAKNKQDAIVFVVTAHPTEARAPGNLMIFRRIHGLLIRAISENDLNSQKEALRHELELAWRAPIARGRRPTVLDEAEHIYGLILREEILTEILTISQRIGPVYFRSWVGGDKDGHPGVNEKTMKASLEASRELLLRFAKQRAGEVRESLEFVIEKNLRRQVRELVSLLERLRPVGAGDARRVAKLRLTLADLSRAYERQIGALHPSLQLLRSLLEAFPGLVVPLELRESSDQLERALHKPGAPINRMVRLLARISKGGNPQCYVRGLVVSMASRPEHVRHGESCVARHLRKGAIPVIPLFEQEGALRRAPEIVRDMLRSRPETLEIMVGYSDSAKEKGVLASRLAICEAVQKVDALCRKAGTRAIFFHGSGGSVDRGGGSIREQTAWWPKSALRLYKATIQGEMVERSFSSPEIARGLLERIAQRAEQSAGTGGKGGAGDQGWKSGSCAHGVREFAAAVAKTYSEKVAQPEFLQIVQHATDYPFLERLKIGSRPVARNAILSVSALRAIPWVLCWTQSRVLFPTWWGVGSAWSGLDSQARRALRKAFAEDPVFGSYVKQLGFTLAKVELPIWRVYLENSGLPRPLILRTIREFEMELAAAKDFVRNLSGERDLLWFRPWLGESIALRSAMIHPLNLLQVLSFESGDFQLIRETVTGISSGMMTTG